MIDRDLAFEVERAIEAREAVREWRELRRVFLGSGGIRPGPDYRPGTIPLSLRRRNGTPPDELARLVADLGELVVEDGDQLIQVVGRVYARYLELRGVDVDPWRRRALNPWTSCAIVGGPGQLRSCASSPAPPPPPTQSRRRAGASPAWG